MPVHIEYKHICVYIVVAHRFHDVAEIICRIIVVLAVPISQHIIRRQGNLARYQCEIIKGFLIIVAIAEKIEVKSIGVCTRCRPVDAARIRHESQRTATVGTLERRRVINDSPARTGYQAVLEPRAIIVAVVAVERAVGAFKILRILQSGIPHHRITVNRHRDTQIGWRGRFCKRIAALAVAQAQRVGGDCHILAVVRLRILGHGKLPVNHGKRGIVLEHALRAVFYPYHFRTQHREAGAAILNHRIRRRFGAGGKRTKSCGNCEHGGNT